MNTHSDPYGRVSFCIFPAVFVFTDPRMLHGGHFISPVGSAVFRVLPKLFAVSDSRARDRPCKVRLATLAKTKTLKLHFSRGFLPAELRNISFLDAFCGFGAPRGQNTERRTLHGAHFISPLGSAVFCVLPKLFALSGSRASDRACTVRLDPLVFGHFRR